MNDISFQELYVKSKQREKRRVSLLRIAIFLFLLVVWEVCVRTGALSGFLFSSPSRIVLCMAAMVKDGTFFYHLGITLLETIVSFFIVTILGVVVAIILWCFPMLSKVMEPYLVMLNSLPKSALAPILIVWLGANVKTIIIAGISVAVFGNIIQLYTAFVSVDEESIKLIRTLGGTKRHIMQKVLLPGSVAALIGNMKVNIGLCLVGVVIGEFLAAKAGLGYLIIYGSQVFQLNLVMMSLFILCIISIVFYKSIQFLEKKIT